MRKEVKKYMEGSASEEEMHKLLQWLEQNNLAEFERIKNEWKANLEPAETPLKTLIELDRFKSNMLKDDQLRIRKTSFLQNIYKYAAILFLFLAIGSVIFYPFISDKNRELQYSTVFADNGQVSKSMLPDGTMIWLNSGSSIKYNTNFGIDNRDVELEGQAFFDVTKNEKLPMIVSCDQINVKVLGTQFTAESYSESENINVVLVEGSVELRAKNNRKAFAKMKPDQRLVYNKNDRKYEILKVETKNYTGWKEGVIQFYNQPLKKVVLKLCKRYNQEIVLDKKLENYEVTFSIRNEELSDVMNLILAITPATAIQKNDTVYIDKREQ